MPLQTLSVAADCSIRTLVALRGPNCLVLAWIHGADDVAPAATGNFRDSLYIPLVPGRDWQIAKLCENGCQKR
jgi:hypothetical protein